MWTLLSDLFLKFGSRFCFICFKVSPATNVGLCGPLVFDFRYSFILVAICERQSSHFSLQNSSKAPVRRMNIGGDSGKIKEFSLLCGHTDKSRVWGKRTLFFVKVIILGSASATSKQKRGLFRSVMIFRYNEGIGLRFYNTIVVAWCVFNVMAS